MSDGPYRSLPMIGACKRFAKRAHHRAFDEQDIAEAVCPTLTAHWSGSVSAELLNKLWSVCEMRQSALFGDDRPEKLEAARLIAAGQGVLSTILIDCVEQSLESGRIGKDAMIEAAHNALVDQAMRDVRTIEEHYLRESTPRKSTEMRERMLQGISQAPTRDLAGQLIDQSAPAVRSPPRHGGLDDGVRL